jgi:Tol biopolymer transport system component
MSDSAPTLTAELVVDSAVPRYPAISPDGRWVAFAVAAFGVTEPPLSALWVAAADGSSPPRKLTAAAARDCVPRWAPDSASLFFGAGQQLHRIGRDGGPARALTTWRAGIAYQ